MQDVIENLFGLCRGRNGNNFNLSAFEFGNVLGRIISTKILIGSASLNSNCEDDNDKLVEYFSCVVQSSSNSESILTVEKENNIQNDNDIKNDEVLVNSLEALQFENICHLSLSYTIGYVLFKILSKISCETCKENLTKTNLDKNIMLERENFIKNKNFSLTEIHLLVPSDNLFEISKFHIETFRSFFNSQPQSLNIKGEIIKLCIKNVEKSHPSWFDDANCCSGHHKQILEFLIVILLRKHCIWFTRDIKSNMKSSEKKKFKKKIEK